MECQPKNGPTRILAVALWLKLKRKFFSEGTVKEACQLFNIRAKQLSRIITGCKYLGGTQQKQENLNALGQSQLLIQKNWLQNRRIKGQPEVKATIR